MKDSGDDVCKISHI